MTAPNHALTGALIGLYIANPWAAVPLAVLSHFACDAIPHYDPPGSEISRIGSRRLVFEQIYAGGLLCVLLVGLLVVTQPAHWLLVAICAFLAVSPDLLWIPRWRHIRRTGKEMPRLNWFLRMHRTIQWKTGPKFWWVEFLWFLGCTSLIAHRIG